MPEDRLWKGIFTVFAPDIRLDRRNQYGSPLASLD
jgi:hypothetical protein